jgi:mRNA interferase RelE/StbE
LNKLLGRWACLLDRMYSISIEKNAENFLKKLGREEAEIILKKIYSIRENPFRFVKRLQGEKLWRLRIGDYRAIIDVVISMNKILVLRIGHRKKVYD